MPKNRETAKYIVTLQLYETDSREEYKDDEDRHEKMFPMLNFLRLSKLTAKSKSDCSSETGCGDQGAWTSPT